MNPYEVLGIGLDADDTAVRSAYLGLVKRFPPERHPEKFKEISSAYEKLKNADRRLGYYLFDQGSPVRSPFEALLVQFGRDEKRRPLAFEEMKEYLRKCSKRLKNS
jgi:curved DNA-binding protein CbpA